MVPVVIVHCDFHPFNCEWPDIASIEFGALVIANDSNLDTSLMLSSESLTEDIVCECKDGNVNCPFGLHEPVSNFHIVLFVWEEEGIFDHWVYS